MPTALAMGSAKARSSRLSKTTLLGKTQTITNAPIEKNVVPAKVLNSWVRAIGFKIIKSLSFNFGKLSLETSMPTQNKRNKKESCTAIGCDKL